LRRGCCGSRFFLPAAGTISTASRDPGRLEPLIQIIRSAVRDSLEKSQADQAGCDFAMDMILACCLRNFRKALFDNWRPKDLTTLLAKQVNRILGHREVIDPCAPADYEVSLERRLAKV
jgi:hypothetical protein